MQVDQQMVCVKFRVNWFSCFSCSLEIWLWPLKLLTVTTFPRVCVSSDCVPLSVCLSAAACPHYCTDPDVTWRNGTGCPLVVHYWVDLQSVHMTAWRWTRSVSEYMLVFAVYLVCYMVPRYATVWCHQPTPHTQVNKPEVHAKFEFNHVCDSWKNALRCNLFLSVRML